MGLETQVQRGRRVLLLPGPTEAQTKFDQNCLYVKRTNVFLVGVSPAPHERKDRPCARFQNVCAQETMVLGIVGLLVS